MANFAEINIEGILKKYQEACVAVNSHTDFKYLPIDIRLDASHSCFNDEHETLISIALISNYRETDR